MTRARAYARTSSLMGGYGVARWIAFDPPQLAVSVLRVEFVRLDGDGAPQRCIRAALARGQGLESRIMAAAEKEARPYPAAFASAAANIRRTVFIQTLRQRR